MVQTPCWEAVERIVQSNLFINGLPNTRDVSKFSCQFDSSLPVFLLEGIRKRLQEQAAV